MKLANLLKNIKIKNSLTSNPEILSVEFDANKVKKGSLFVSLKNEPQNLLLAIKNGAVACVINNEFNLNVPCVVVANVRKAFSLICKNFYNCACDSFKIVMVTGTNGKTSVTYILNNIFKCCGIKSAIVGTNGIFFDNKQLYYGLTTPDPNDLHYYFNELKKLNVTHVVMEASAHAIKLCKLAGIKAEQIIFTNITNEHLDFFKTMKKYANTKLNFINKNNTSLAIVNVDDGFGVKLLNKNLQTISYGLTNPADSFAIDINNSIMGLSFVCNVMDNIININSKLMGLYNVYNILAAITSAVCLGLDIKKIELGVNSLVSIPGRFNKYLLDLNNLVIIDFAHTPDGFFNVLSEVRVLRKGKVITLFGCVGYSDKQKRILMGEVASKFSDELILTTDNPNFENFDDICSDISKNVSVPYTKIFNREQAVEYAFSKLEKNSTIMLLGKGAETSNLINGVKVPYSEISTVEKCIEQFYNVKKGVNNDVGVI